MVVAKGSGCEETDYKRHEGNVLAMNMFLP